MLRTLSISTDHLSPRSPSIGAHYLFSRLALEIDFVWQTCRRVCAVHRVLSIILVPDGKKLMYTTSKTLLSTMCLYSFKISTFQAFPSGPLMAVFHWFEFFCVFKSSANSCSYPQVLNLGMVNFPFVFDLIVIQLLQGLIIMFTCHTMVAFGQSRARVVQPA